MRVVSLFSGIEAASVAARPLGWEFVAFAEIDPHACRVLHHHHGCGRPLHLPDPESAPDGTERARRAARIRAVADLPLPGPGCPPNLGDVSRIDWAPWRGKVDAVVGGPPCQAFSFAGLRLSLRDNRGNLMFEFVRAIHETGCLLSFAENVPGFLSTPDNAFGCYLGAVVGAGAPLDPPGGKRWGSAGMVDGPLCRAAWRVIDAQGFVPQRRRRVYVVGARVGSGGDPVRVLFETEADLGLHLGERLGRGPLFPLGESLPRPALAR